MQLAVNSSHLGYRFNCCNRTVSLIYSQLMYSLHGTILILSFPIITKVGQRSWRVRAELNCKWNEWTHVTVAGYRRCHKNWLTNHWFVAFWLVSRRKVEFCRLRWWRRAFRCCLKTNRNTLRYVYFRTFSQSRHNAQSPINIISCFIATYK